MLTLLLLAPPLGVVTGYLITATLTANFLWHWAFYAQSILALMPASFLIFLIKGKYFDIEMAVEKKFEEIEDHHKYWKACKSQTGGTDDHIKSVKMPKKSKVGV